ncbi:uncharacterized protein FIBRA_08099 [Fibroporia radiculosa]|uniref:Protein kinase domain-containing protein n=1 Tax=Fibroporia radiculosa TaxID=599839 RepID=J4GGG1_9APHY|nr:uncharacterized protein FIBRA_08099 [Fibroporia radiculosa]CCM05863.1 predicted protein [Fibroporia radiculosa]
MTIFPKTTSASLIPDMVNQIIDDGRLELVEKLGEGGYGVVYRAIVIESTSSLKPTEYAVKILAKACERSREWRLQRREIAAHTLVSDHPNILTLHQVIEDDNFIYLVVDYCPGGDLFSAIIDRHAYSENDDLVKKVFVQILDAVHSCHEKGIYHRDLKPDNILCMNEEASEIVLGDFGLSTKSRTSTTFGCGSSNYISPECIGKECRYRPYSPRIADVWALGVILVNMIAGRHPWNNAATDDKCFMRFMVRPGFLRKMLPISRSANTILRRIFTLDAGLRITIPELRTAILKVDTFFMAQDEIEKGNRFLRFAAAAYAADRADTVCSAAITALREDNEIQIGSEHIADEFIAEDAQSHLRIAGGAGTTAFDSESESESGEDSDGLITPESHAQDSASLVKVSKVSDGADVGIVDSPVIRKKHEHILPVESLIKRLKHVALR